MIQMKTDQGGITINNIVFTNIVGMAASNCFGVKGMAVRSMTDGLVHLLRREARHSRVPLPVPPAHAISTHLFPARK